MSAWLLRTAVATGCLWCWDETDETRATWVTRYDLGSLFELSSCLIASTMVSHSGETEREFAIFAKGAFGPFGLFSLALTVFAYTGLSRLSSWATSYGAETGLYSTPDTAYGLVNGCPHAHKHLLRTHHQHVFSLDSDGRPDRW